MNTTIGGDRLGSGNKQNISFKNYERSTHDLSYIWRSSMASGTLVPFMSEVGLPGDSFEIDLNCEVLTLPTVGPLFGSYKVQLDVFSIPIRLYNANLHMNLLGVGLDMKSITLPQMLLRADKTPKPSYDDNDQVNSSCIFSYLNIRGLGRPGQDNTAYLERAFNAVPWLAYWDIYKQYYANKQEEEGVVIHSSLASDDYAILTATGECETSAPQMNILDRSQNLVLNNTLEIIVDLYDGAGLPNWTDLKIKLGTDAPISLADHCTTMQEISEHTRKFIGWKVGSPRYNTWVQTSIAQQVITAANNDTPDQAPKLERFMLQSIDDMRKYILTRVNDATVFTNLFDYPPYNMAYKVTTVNGNEYDFAQRYAQEGLAIKTYQSDLFNNWISTEWIDGTNGINEITSVSTVGDSFTIDALNLASKVYAMLNRIAISGGSYDDWLDAVYTHERSRGTENPVYHGSLIRELAFQEVVSTAASGDQPLGNLAGRGALTGKTKGGKVNIKVDEPCYIMGIASITPRVDYSQGNKWDVNLKTLDDFHKPALDEIGYQDLITDQMAWFDTLIDEDYDSGAGVPKFKSAGKQPAWINYMTNVNQVRGSFAEKYNSMFMVLNRRYESGADGITDLTTYIDPTKFNHIFADTRIDAMNFWVQIGNNITARRKMSAKVIPNL